MAVGPREEVWDWVTGGATVAKFLTLWARCEGGGRGMAPRGRAECVAYLASWQIGDRWDIVFWRI